MLYKMMKEEKFQTLMQKHIEDVLMYCFEKDQHFGILCKIEHVGFEPWLPQEIHKEFRDVTLFFLAGYTFETAKIQGDDLVFEAGFGAENIGSVLTVPLLSILQIIVDDTPILINVANYTEKKTKTIEPATDDGVQNSMAALLSNPENKKFQK